MEGLCKIRRIRAHGFGLLEPSVEEGSWDCVQASRKEPFSGPQKAGVRREKEGKREKAAILRGQNQRLDRDAVLFLERIFSHFLGVSVFFDLL